MNLSEVAQLKKQIECECQAMNLALYGYSEVASHHIINSRYSAIGRCQDQLETLVGEEAAATIVVDVYNKVIG